MEWEMYPMMSVHEREGQLTLEVLLLRAKGLIVKIRFLAIHV
jgi:hypothetical protein